MRRGVSILFMLTAGVLGCGGPLPSSPAEVAIAPAAPTVPDTSSPPSTPITRPPRDTFADLFLPDPPLDGFEPPITLVFRQETWLGAGDFQQHCHELGYEKRFEPEVLRQVNATLEAHGVPPRLPNTVRQAPYVFSFDASFKPALVDPKEPVLKLFACTEIKGRRAERDLFFARLKARGLVPDLPFGEPTGAWIRLFQTGEREWGSATRTTRARSRSRRSSRRSATR